MTTPTRRARRFDTVLVANRGEIAVRVIRACRAAGLRSVAVYSDADRHAPHVQAADAAVRIGPAPAAESYLNIAALLEGAERAGAGAVHPGYGFLSERAAFASAVDTAGLVFVGPPPAAIEVMGRKDRARQIAVKAGLPVIPAAGGGADDLEAVAAEVGFPLLAKAAAGGGGKGMRIVRGLDELRDSVAAAQREAMAAFGDDAMLFERYIERGRHIEVQVLADEHGAVVHLYERDCSVQRRHQKVIEEAPAPTIGAQLRDAVCSSAVALAREVGYVNAGTVEFLVSGDEAYFLEMNTRLQVEHPVTEAVTGLDLVALQLSIAQGDPLPFDQHDITVTGHALEARVYAEDPAHGFLPQAGVADVVVWPSRARVDEALASGQAVSTHYDPMLGKVIVHGSSREAARQSLVAALDDTAILGLTTNAGFLRTLADSREFADAAIHTAWLDAHVVETSLPEDAWVMAAWAIAVDSGGAGDDSPFGRRDGWRLGGPPAAIPVELRLVDADDGPRVVLVSTGDATVRLDERELDVVDAGSEPPRLSLDIAGSRRTGHAIVDRHHVMVAYRGQSWAFERRDAFAGGAHAPVSDGTVTAPMPGTMLRVAVVAGQRVGAGDVLGVLEAMKMELSLNAPFDGTVAAVQASEGAQIELGAALFVIEPHGDDQRAAAADPTAQPRGGA
jgi:3-methylcrotonyl-CoA carboxylase alpha subunit/acetyl-CoA/propionyl-CoA carboxylase biotin carboxyl carrier protein